MVSKIIKSVYRLFAMDHQRLLSRDIIAKYLGMLVIVIVIPFAVSELVNARYLYFLIDMIVILAILQDLVCMHLYARPLIPRYLIAVIVGITIWLLTYYRGSVGIYWSYPYVMFSHFLLRPRSSVIIIFLFLAGTAPLAYHTFEGIEATWVMVTLTMLAIGILFMSFVEKQQRSSLFENQEKYKTLVETSLQGLLIVNVNENPIFANATMARLLGFDSPEELTSLDSLVSLYHPGETARLTGYTKARLRNESAPISYEVRWLKKDGSIVWFLANVQILKWEGEQVAHGVYIDITDRKRTEEELERHRASLSESKKKYEMLVETSLQGFLIVNENEKPIFANMAMANMLGFDSPEDLAQLETLESLYHPEESERLIEYTRARLKNEPVPKTYEVKWYRKDRSIVWFLANVQVLEWDGEQVAQALYLDITERKLAEEDVRKLSRAVESSSSAVMITDFNGDIEYVNPKFSEITGHLMEDVIGKNPRFLQSGETLDSVYADLWSSITSGREWRGELYNRRKDGVFYWARHSISAVKDAQGVVTHFIDIQDDVTHEYERTEQLSYRASHDILTGLINRYEFERRIENLLADTHQGNRQHSLCFMDLDYFKIINDSCGHSAGDEVLRLLGGVMQNSIRKSDTLARLGGDEFGVLMEHCSLQHALKVAENILKNVDKFDFHWENQSFHIGISIGLVAITDVAENLAEVLQEADAACYIAKKKGRNRIHVATQN